MRAVSENKHCNRMKPNQTLISYLQSYNIEFNESLQLDVMLTGVHEEQQSSSFEDEEESSGSDQSNGDTSDDGDDHDDDRKSRQEKVTSTAKTSRDVRQVSP